MSLEHSPARQKPDGATQSDEPEKAPPDPQDYWNSLINETEAGDFLGLSDRAMQKMRQRGGGSRFIRISARCIRYRRIDLKTWADARLRSSTSDPGQARPPPDADPAPLPSK